MIIRPGIEALFGDDHFAIEQYTYGIAINFTIVIEGDLQAVCAVCYRLCTVDRTFRHIQSCT